MQNQQPEVTIGGLWPKQPATTQLMIGSPQMQTFVPSTLLTMLMRSVSIERMHKISLHKDVELFKAMDASRSKLLERIEDTDKRVRSIFDAMLEAAAREELEQFRVRGVLSLDLSEYACMLVERHVALFHSLDAAFAAIHCAWLSHGIAMSGKTDMEQKLHQKLFTLNARLRKVFLVALKQFEASPQLQQELIELRHVRYAFEHSLRSHIERERACMIFVTSANTSGLAADSSAC